MTRNRGFSDIRTYEELEASIRMVQHPLRTARISRQVNGLMAGQGLGIKWTDVALVILRLIKRSLS